ncbi:MAG: aminodeoxychorismate synthase component I [Phaeodactylibacter sp.]|nr:aminodeoxychorismate synthase component I [Phaeodactylibacter sp.]
MITTLEPKEAIRRMNSWGRQGEPFLFIVDFEMERPVALKLSEVPESCLLYDINGIRNFTGGQPLGRAAFFEKHPMPREEYRQAFQLVMDHLRAGNSYLVNLAFPTPISTNLSLKEAFFTSRARYRLWWEGRFACFSPEPFITIDEEGQLSSFPMKGTIDAAMPDARNQLINNAKEKAEHATIVDLIRNDLSMVAENVRVKRYRYVEEVETHQGGLLQSSSEITGQLGRGYRSRLGDILFQLLPAGSISGAPKRKTVEIIQAAEGQRRGYYTGICGIFDGRRLDSGVMIRFIEQTPQGMVFKSGGGITANSREEEEYQEMLRKAYLPFANTPELIGR